MKTIQEVFGKKRVLLPVLHRATMSSVEIAVEADADGIFLINQGIDVIDIFRLIELDIKKKYPDLWIGVNFLGYKPEAVIHSLYDLPNVGVWSDRSGNHHEIKKARKTYNWNGLYFGGVAFKYQTDVPFDHLEEEAKKACTYMDVPTTSGPGTGQSASVPKVVTMKKAMGKHPLALASGVSPENVELYLPWVDAFLVATGIEDSFGVLNPERTELLARLIHGK